MRSLIDIATKEQVNVNNLSDKFIWDLGKILNTPEMLHIDTVYFTKNGSYYFNVHEYKGNDKEFKNRKFARFEYQNIKLKDQTGVERWKRQSHPNLNFEIIKEYDAKFFVDAYIKNIKNN